ncbi:hypothetical protein Q5530_36855 [Saccharothrix sp. BKS2]|uniref:hypothetical protein n=1 Tax=Saccharothrix sp. BKS2 TaxID=3064400 RepID=UPI0039EC387D
MSDRIAVDVDALRKGGVDIDATAQLAISICGDLRHSVELYGNSGGTGEMGEMFNEKYRPSAEMALKFLSLLEEVLGGASERTVGTSQSFDAAIGDADAVTNTL